MVYFIRETSGCVKIGYTASDASFRHRLHTVNCLCPTHIIETYLVEGDRALEDKLHDRFSHLRVKGEWFKWGSEIEAYLDTEGVPHKGKSMTRQEREAFLLVTDRHLHTRPAVILRVMFHARLTPRQALRVEVHNGFLRLDGRTLDIPQHVLDAATLITHNGYLFTATERQLRRIWDEFRPKPNLSMRALSNWS